MADLRFLLAIFCNNMLNTANIFHLSSPLSLVQLAVMVCVCVCVSFLAKSNKKRLGQRAGRAGTVPAVNMTHKRKQTVSQRSCEIKREIRDCLSHTLPSFFKYLTFARPSFHLLPSLSHSFLPSVILTPD